MVNNTYILFRPKPQKIKTPAIGHSSFARRPKNVSVSEDKSSLSNILCVKSDLIFFSFAFEHFLPLSNSQLQLNASFCLYSNIGVLFTRRYLKKVALENIKSDSVILDVQEVLNFVMSISENVCSSVPQTVKADRAKMPNFTCRSEFQG